MRLNLGYSFGVCVMLKIHPFFSPFNSLLYSHSIVAGGLLETS